MRYSGCSRPPGARRSLAADHVGVEQIAGSQRSESGGSRDTMSCPRRNTIPAACLESESGRNRKSLLRSGGDAVRSTVSGPSENLALSEDHISLLGSGYAGLGLTISAGFRTLSLQR